MFLLLLERIAWWELERPYGTDDSTAIIMLLLSRRLFTKENYSLAYPLDYHSSNLTKPLPLDL